MPRQIPSPLQTPFESLSVTHFEDRVMAQAKDGKSTKVKVDEHRDQLRAQALRSIQVWAPDVRSPSFRAEAHRQSVAVTVSAHAPEDQAFIDAASEWDVE